MLLDSHDEIAGASIVKEKTAVTEPPQRSASKFVTARQTLRYPVIKLCSHLVKGQIRIKPHGFIAQGGHSAEG